MRPRLAELLAYMDSTREKLFATVAGIGPAFAMVRPREGTWSPAENLAHLARVEQGVARLVTRSVEWAKTHGVAPEESDSSILSSLDRYSIVNPVRTMIAPPMVAPSGEIGFAESIDALKASRAALREALLSGEGLDLETVSRPHPAFGELNLYQWALFVAQHEERHRLQIERTVREVTGLAAECAPIV